MRLRWFAIILVLTTCSSNADDDLSFDVQGSFQGSLVSTRNGREEIDLQIRRTGENQIQIQLDSLSTGASFNAELSEQDGVIYLTVSDEELENGFVRSRGAIGGFDGKYVDSTARFEYQIEVSNQSNFTPSWFETFVGQRPTN